MGFMSKLQEWFEGPPEPTPLQTYRNYLREYPGYTIDGIIMGMYGDGTPSGKTMGCDGHVLVVGGSASGKTSGIAIPTLRYGWKAPALVVDVKGELYGKSNRSNAYVFNPLLSSSAGYDPFYPVYSSPHPVSDIEDIAQIIVPMPPHVKEPFWILSAQSILAAHLLYAYKRGATFLQAINTLQRTPIDITMEIIEEEDDEASLFLTQCLNLPDTVISGIMQELSTRIRPFVTNEYLKASLSKRNVITPQLLEQGYDIFLQLPSDKLAVLQPLMSLMIQQFLRSFEQRGENRSNRHILFMLDEFPRLGKMDMVLHGLTTLRSKNITIMLIIQSLAQLDVTYGQDQRKVILDNCDFKAILRANDADTQQYFSRLFGTYEHTKESFSSSQTKGSDPKSKSDTAGSSTSTEDKPRIKPEEFGTLQNILYFNTEQSGLIYKVPYWQI